jgi:hypothetical protein
MIKTVIRVQNGMVMVFDENGEQLPEYQGFYQDVRDNIMSDAPEGTVFNHWFGHGSRSEPVNMEAW